MAIGIVQNISIAGLVENMLTPNSTEQIIPATGQFLQVRNASGSACVVTIVDPGLTPSGSPSVNPTVTVPATTGAAKIYLPPSLANPATGTIQVNFSVTASITAALIRVGV
jgi:hypothetical protein